MPSYSNQAVKSAELARMPAILQRVHPLACLAGPDRKFTLTEAIILALAQIAVFSLKSYEAQTIVRAAGLSTTQFKLTFCLLTAAHQEAYGQPPSL